MSYSIAIASGKGGTGKTTVAVSLYQILSDKLNGKVKLVDCDVEEPNDRLFFSNAPENGKQEVNKLVPVISNDACTYCRKCVEYCEFNAIVVIPSAEYAVVSPDLCHSCGACLVACEYNAMHEQNEAIGYINNYLPNIGSGLAEGRLKIGSTMQTMLIRELKKSIKKDISLIIYDAPPGTSCPVVETISDVDYVILVAEPTPFGVHDLKLMMELLWDINKPFSVVINKSGLGDDEIYKYLSENKVEIIGEIPFNKSFAAAYASGNIQENIPDDIRTAFNQIAGKIERRIDS